jgi:hypothetical protein
MDDEVARVRGTWLGRIYPDTVLSGLCFFLLSLSVGRIWRAPFDDEMDAIGVIQRFRPLEMFREIWGVLDHPPLFYVVFASVYQIVPSLGCLRLFALICSTLSIFFFHQLFLNVGNHPTTGDRIIAIFAFATIPLFLKFGDAIRWYPIFTLLFAFLVVTLVRRPNATWVPAGLLGALSFVNLEGFLITASVGLYRYVIERRRIISDLKFIALTASLQALSLPYYYKIFTSAPLSAEQEHGYLAKGLRSYYELFVGFFGGFTFGIGLIWVLLPIIAISGLALFQVIRRFSDTDAIERLALVTLGLSAAWATIWTNAYAFIYAALMMTYVVLKVLSRNNSAAVKAAVMFTFLLTNGAAIGNLQDSDHPFFRTYPAPYQEMAAAISRNFAPGDLVISTDANLVTLLDAKVDCVRVFNDVRRAGPDCPLRKRPTRVLLVEGRSNLVQVFNKGKPSQAFSKGEGTPWEDVVEDLTAGRRLVASIPYKYDADAALKTRLSGETLDPFVFSIQIFE